MKKFLSSLALAVLALVMVACGGGSGGGSSNLSQDVSGNMFMTGEDAPVASVLSFNITLTSITLNGQSHSPQVLSAPTTVDFARLIGLRSLIGFNAVPADTYTGATITMSSPVITYLNVGTTPPTAPTMNGTLTTSTVTVAFPTPMVVSGNGLAGMHMDFDLRQSLAVDGTGQITGSVDPHIYIMAVSASDEEGQVTDLTGGLVSVNASANTFVLQGPYGRQFTIDTNAQTQFNGSYSINNMAAPEFVSIQGTVQADGSVLASNVEVVATTQAFVSGRILALSPATGAVQSVTIFVGEELPALSGIPTDSVLTLDVSSVNQYDICFFDNWFTGQLFGNTSMVVGQRIFIGGSYDSSSNTFTPTMISLRRQGVVGDLVANSVNITSGNQGSFELQNNNLLGYVLGAPLQVNTGDGLAGTLFIGVNGLSGLQAGGQTNLVARGLVFKDPPSGNPVLWAHRVRVLP